MGEGLSKLDNSSFMKLWMVTEGYSVSDMFIPPADLLAFHCCFMFILRFADMQIPKT